MDHWSVLEMPLRFIRCQLPTGSNVNKHLLFFSRSSPDRFLSSNKATSKDQRLIFLLIDKILNCHDFLPGPFGGSFASLTLAGIGLPDPALSLSPQTKVPLLPLLSPA